MINTWHLEVRYVIEFCVTKFCDYIGQDIGQRQLQCHVLKKFDEANFVNSVSRNGYVTQLGLLEYEEECSQEKQA